MNQTQQGIVALLKSAVTGEVLSLPDGFDLEAAYGPLKSHHMSALIYEGAVRCGIPGDLAVMRRLFQSYCKSLQVSEGQQRQLERVFGAFEAAGIDYLPLKGCKMKTLYPKPELRIMGDADVLIRLEQYPRIVPIMESLGFVNNGETDHELVWQSRELYLELHKHVIPSYNEDFFSYFGDGWQLARVNNGCRYSMSAEDEFVFLFTHFAKHYRDGGIGCRYVVDLWVYLRANPGMDEGEVRRKLAKLQLLTFYENIRRVIAVWFEDARSDDRTDYITDFVFSSGSWGSGETRSASIAVRDSHGGSFWRGRLAYFWRTAFPDRNTLQGKYTVLRRAPWLLPAVWLIRPFYKVFFEYRTLDKQKRNISALSDGSLDERRRGLQYVGLDYNF